MMTDTAQTRHWIVFRLGHLGDVVLATGVLARLGREFGLEFTVVCKQPYTEIFDRHPFVRRCIGLGADELGTAAFFRFCRKLAAEYDGDGLLDLHGTFRSRILAACLRGPVRRYPKMSCTRRLFLASGKRLGREALLASNVPQRYYAAYAAPPPPPAAELLPRIRLSEEERSAAATRLEQLFGKGARPVALHPYATHLLKAWPGDHWRALAALLDRAGIPWISIGIGEPLFAGKPNDLSNSGSLRESCALLARCRALVTGDSGPMHLAAAVDTPVVALFGPTTREWGFYPAGPRDTVLERDLPCRPCSLHGDSACPDNRRCLAEILPQQVLEAVLRTPDGPPVPETDTRENDAEGNEGAPQ